MVILHEGSPVKVMEFHHHTPGNLRAMVQARLRNLLTGNSFEYRFRSNDTLEKITLEQHSEANAHVECRKDAAVIDESPAAYKSIDAVMAAQQDLVEVVHTLRQVVCIKG